MNDNEPCTNNTRQSHTLCKSTYAASMHSVVNVVSWWPDLQSTHNLSLCCRDIPEPIKRCCLKDSSSFSMKASGRKLEQGVK